MSKEVNNPMLDVPIEFEEGETSNATDENKDEPSLEEIAAEIERRASTEETNDVIDPIKEAIEPKEEVITDPRFVNKTAEEMIEIYQNVEKLAKAHDTELGTLRKEIKEYKDKEEEERNLNLGEIEKEIIPAMQKMTPEEKKIFFEEFNTSPETAIEKLFKSYMKPFARKQATVTTKEEIDKLIGLHKDSVVPYVEKDINALISANKGWWAKYKTGIYEHAYDIIRNRDFNKYAAIRNQELEEKEQQRIEQENDMKKKIFVEGGAPAKIVQKDKTVSLKQLRHASPETAMSAIEKILEERGIPTNA